jgi:hypothetical protein
MTSVTSDIYAKAVTQNEAVVHEADTLLEHYQVVDMVYEERPARVLFSGQRSAAQSGVARDSKPDLLFDYNQRLFELATSLQPARILLIGGGVYTLPSALAKVIDSHVTVVEPDSGLDDIAIRYFAFRESDQVSIVHNSGREFLKNNKTPYDLIIVDAYQDTTVPKSLTSLQAIQQLKRNLTTSGTIAINLITSYYGRNSELVRSQYEYYKTMFRHVTVYPANRNDLSFWLPQNFILVAGHHQPKNVLLRYEAMPPLPIKGEYI